MLGLLKRFASHLRIRLPTTAGESGSWSQAGIVLTVGVVMCAVLLAIRGLGLDAWSEAWLFPILLSTSLWGRKGAAASSAVAALAVSPLVLRLVAPAASPPFGPLSWLAQAGVYSLFSMLAIILFNRHFEASRITKLVQADGHSSGLEGYERILASLANTVEVRDHHTQGHCERVARNALVMGKSLGLTTREQSVLYWAARLHDLGKIAVPEYILMKSGRLTEEEFAEIRRHPSYGADLLASVSQAFRPIADVVRAHHERWDGLGYPLGYRGEEIPRLARIIAIVDVFEALTSERPYRSPMPEPQALRYVANGAGTQFDPDLVARFQDLYELGKLECASHVPHDIGRDELIPERLAFHNG